ncbi:hypothetical protein KP509_01G098100 [Ceratopteris richardii]|uniref:F-box domain-containing protein n=1 Tax=Ceratopteris richardii TaxID=49495 RepID=A0A8T2VND4_CERRI|nr:hypothetical protein KP509_01G098100 [Ceratopteris richardii]KAH7447236.1 hypothetical protein KP509_01G098100 [Ceratopteris richardii]
MANCSVQNLSAWPQFLSNHQGICNFSPSSTLGCKVGSSLGLDTCTAGLDFTKICDSLKYSNTQTVEQSDSGLYVSSELQIDFDIGTIIPSLPDDISKTILGLAGKDDLPTMGLVSKSWNAVIRSKEFYKIRRDMGTTESCLYALTLSEDGCKTSWREFNSVRNEWKELIPMPGPLKNGSGFAVVNGKLLVIGGAVDGYKATAVADVLVYDTSLNRWHKVASMHTARYEFACAVLNGLVYVVGGHGLDGKKLSNVEVYDPEQDLWMELPSLRRARWGCIAGGLGGKLYVMAGRSSFTIGHSRRIDIFDPMKGQWEEAKNGCMMVLTHAIVDQELFCIEWKNDRKLAVFNAIDNSWKSVSVPLAGSCKMGFYLANVNEKLVLFPTSSEVPCDTLIYDPHAPSDCRWQTIEFKPLGTCICCTTLEA